MKRKREDMSQENLFVKTQAKDIISTKTLIVVDITATVGIALNTLAEHNIYSAPVRDSASKKWVGFISMQDIVHALVGTFAKKAGIAPTFDLMNNASWDDADLEGINKSFLNIPLKDAINSAGGNEWSTITPTTTLADIIKRLGGKQDRIPVEDKGEVIALISKSTVVQFLKNHLKELPSDKVNKSLADAQVGRFKGLICAMPGTRAIDGFAALAEYGISHLALVEDNGTLRGNLSVKDVCHILKNFPKLLQDAYEFVNEIRRSVISTTTFPAIFAHETDSVARTLERLAVIKIHRVYITKKETRVPYGVVSVGDIVNYFA
eukprot:TRINITY_DN1611_c0_g4_i2.p1 TRINITY_DN1611_c0_g4~~TRINITY_DN1611_c0_g4_i2.p1  ORF type:complete len:321 (-),score=61.11 TRINITY_DN1611_c0_g4_i2:13-975(-)